MSFNLALPQVGDVIIAHHRHGPPAKGQVVEVYPASIRTPALIFYRIGAAKYVLRLDGTESWEYDSTQVVERPTDEDDLENLLKEALAYWNDKLVQMGHRTAGPSSKSEQLTAEERAWSRTGTWPFNQGSSMLEELDDLPASALPLRPQAFQKPKKGKTE